MISTLKLFPIIIQFLVILLASSTIHAEEKIQWRETFVTVDSDIRPVNGHEGHALGVLQQRGFAFYENKDEAWLFTSNSILQR